MSTTETTSDTKKRTRELVRQRASYTTDQRIRAVTAMLQCNPVHPLSMEAQQAAHKVLGTTINRTSLLQWLKKYRTLIETTDKSLIVKPIDLPELINSTRERVIKNLNSAVNKMSARIDTDEAINNASLRDLSVSMGISIEKILLLAGRDPELDNLTTTLQHECVGTQWQAVDLIQDMINAVRAEKANHKPTIDIESS